MISVSSVSKSFGKLRAVDRVNFSVHSGEIFGLVGPDGAGKTTLMRMVCGLLNPDPGQGSIALQCSGFGYMPQRFSLYGDLSIMENLYFFGSMYKLPKDVIRQRSEEILELTNLLPFKDRLADNLSGGMKQKLALTCALVTRPQLLILDEPTYGVDPESRKEFWKILYQLNSEHITIFVSTPYMDEAELCTRVAFINAGKISIIDTPVRLRADFPYQVWEVVAGALKPGLFEKSEPVLDSSLYGDKFRLIIKPDADAKPLIEQILAANGLSYLSLLRVPPTMEDVFIMMAGG